MKKLIGFIVLLSFFFNLSVAQVAINADGSLPNPKAMLDIKSSTKGILFPRITTATRRNLLAPAQGLIFFDTTTNSLFHYTGSRWVEHIDSNSYLWKQSSSLLYVPNGSRVGINTIPATTLHVHDVNASQIRFQNLFTGGTATDGAVMGVSTTGEFEFRSLEAGRSINISGNGGFSTSMLINSSGIGIGGSIASPAPFTISDISNPQKVVFKNVGPTQAAGIGVFNNALQIHAADVNSKIEIGTGRAPTIFTPIMEIKGNGVVDIKGKVTRSVRTGSDDLIPYAFGRVNSDGTIETIAGNWTVTKIFAGFELNFPTADTVSFFQKTVMVMSAVTSAAGDYDRGAHIVYERSGRSSFRVMIANNNINIPSFACGQSCPVFFFDEEEPVGRRMGFSFVLYKLR